TAQEKGNKPIFSVSLAGNDVKKVFDDATNGNLDVTSSAIFFTHQSAVRPVEIYSVGIDGKNAKQITHTNDELFSTLDIPSPENIWFKGAGGTQVQAWIFKPPKMVDGAKYPFVYLIHGGPQSAWMNSWSFRWCPALWAAQGYIVMAPNPRGSTGFGQKFINEITGDWGGKVYVDLMRGLDYACRLPDVDSTNKAAAGASFGGYMMSWFQGHAGNRFKTLITHDGVYNFVSMYGTTEEVWFDEWDHSGTPWEKPNEYAKFSPHTYAKNFHTPNLIIHGEKDFRVPVTEAMQLFTTLQRKGIPSKFLYFPDEGHWVLKPANSKLWHETVFGWLKDYLHKGDAAD
ncbi:MAG: S9 family peptidase, partial [bacterium]